MVAATLKSKDQVIAIDLDLKWCREEWHRCRIEGLRDEAKAVLRKADCLLDKRLATRS